MTLTFIDLYNDITGQAWSMFDGEIESQDEFETTVTTSIQKALTTLWCSHNFPFREKTLTYKTKSGKEQYNTPDGNIIRKTIKNETVHCVKCDDEFLTYNPDAEAEETKTGTPEEFYIKNDSIYLYPIPDDVYTISIDYQSIFPAIDGDDSSSKGTLEDDDDYIDIPEKYEVLFKNTLMPLAMTYLIASEQDENYSAYFEQYKLALAVLLEYTKGLKTNKVIGW